jgi:hypothetical protein
VSMQVLLERKHKFVEIIHMIPFQLRL